MLVDGKRALHQLQEFVPGSHFGFRVVAYFLTPQPPSMHSNSPAAHQKWNVLPLHGAKCLTGASLCARNGGWNWTFGPFVQESRSQKL